MKARVRKHGVFVRQDNDLRTWKLSVVWDEDGRPTLYVYDLNDGYYRMTFESRTRLNAFIKQLQQMADEVWPA